MPDFSRHSGSDLITWASSFPPVPAFGSIWVVLCSHKGQITFLEPFPGVPSHLDYTQNLAESILALKLSVTTYFHWVTTTPAYKVASTATFTCMMPISPQFDINLVSFSHSIYRLPLILTVLHFVPERAIQRFIAEWLGKQKRNYWINVC